MSTRRVVRVSVVFLLAVGLLLVFGLVNECKPDSRQSTIALQPPPFLNTVQADESDGPLDIGTKLDEEAGISAYYKTPGAMTLSQARSAFRTIEIETNDYLIGSVAVPGYVEHFDVHVYVHKDGWILAYY